MIFALLSTAIGALLSIGVKRVYKDTNVHPMRLLSVSGWMASVMLAPVWIIMETKALLATSTVLRLVGLLIAAGFVSFAMNQLTNLLIHRLTSLSYAVANTTKRVMVIAVSLLLFQNPVTWLNVAGMLLTILGVFAYNRAKEHQAKQMKQVTTVGDDEESGESDSWLLAVLRSHQDHRVTAACRRTTSKPPAN